MIKKAPARPSRSNEPVSRAPIRPPGLLNTPEDVIAYFARMGLPVDPAIDIEEIINASEELELVRKDLGINDAYIRRIGQNKFEIAVNSRHHPNRQKFSMAHEYAHYLLHRSRINDLGDGERILHRNSIKNSIEYQANKFAAELLMPKHLVKKAFEQNKGSLKGMASTLGVSQDALRYRLEALGYRPA